MRLLTLVAFAALTACSDWSEPAAPEITFDGALNSMPVGVNTHGDRLAWVLGCRGCHGEDLQGKIWDNDPKGYGVTWASNLTRTIPAMTDEQLTILLQVGKHPVREDMWVMPSELFQHLSGADTRALIAYLRTLRPAGKGTPAPVLGPRAKREIASGEVKPAHRLVAELRGVLPADAGQSHEFGRYIATVTCAECHGTKLEGHKNEEGATPDLIVAGGYSRAEFEKLTTTGVPTGNRKLHELMQDVAKNRYSRLTSNERDALYNYLKARAEQPQ